MDATFLRQLLENLCHHFKWDYAVFWKLHHQIPVLFTWEDGYCNNPNTGEFVEGMSDNAYMGETAPNFHHEIDVINGYSPGCEVALAMESMRYLQYSQEEGHVGMVASTGNYCWLSADELSSTLFPELPEELHFQFAVGFKTIFVVPVIPHGVVQLGSLRKVNEDPTLVTHIKDMFNALQRNLEESLPSSLNRCLSSPSPSVTSSLLEKGTLTRRGEMLKPIQSYVEGGNPVKNDDAQVTMMEELKCIPERKFQFGQCHHQAQDHTTHTEFGYKLLDFSAVSFLENQFSDQFLNCNSLTKMEPISPNPFYSEENQLFSSQCGSPEQRVANYTSLGMDSNPFDSMMEQHFLETGEVIDQISSHELLHFTADCELHKALGATSENRGNEDACSSPTLIYNTDFFGGIEQFLEESQGLFMTGEDADNLLDAMISYMCDAPGNLSSSRSNSTTSPTISSGHLAASCQTQSQSTCILPFENGPDPLNSLKTDIETGDGNASTATPSKFALKNTSSLIAKEKKEAKHIQSKKSSTKLSQIGQKRPRQSDDQKQRPRDRQMIQDRVKELRELVPNGGKCSIDALLDQTIKHMLYLRSISNRAENLKQCVYTKSSEKQGASWAVEMDSANFQVCPIVVKDLEQPGLMLIEMLCEENGLFLEIAQVIRRLDLTILKGVMENRMDKSWAHFIVEASAGFRRLDIFWPLMKLLQRNSSISNII
ncbi:hypothetical protein ACHQM5_020159 [Ranunculus cassubicifolius]